MFYKIKENNTIMKLLAVLLVTSLLSGSFVPLRAGADEPTPTPEASESVENPTATPTEGMQNPSSVPDPTATPAPVTSAPTSEPGTPTPVPATSAPTAAPGTATPVPATEPGDISPTPDITPGEEITPSPVSSSLIEKYANGTYENCTAGFIVANYPETEIYEHAADTVLTVGEISEWAFLLAVLQKTELAFDAPATARVQLNGDAAVTVTKAALDAAGKLKYSILAGLKTGDVVKLSDLINMYIITHADDVREVLVSYVFRTETQAVAAMNTAAKAAGMNSTAYVATCGDYAQNQVTTVHDIYILFTQLLKYESFTAKAALESETVTITRANKTEEILCERFDYDDILLYGFATAPEGFSIKYRISGADNKSGGAQAVLVTDEENNEYIFVIGNIPFEKDVSVEIHRLIEMQGAYEDADQELPLGEDDVRYKYIFNTDVVYYTVDNKPRGYRSAAEADRYMMEFTAPVWKYNTSTGKYSEGSMTISINRKVYTSLKAIMEEIFNLPEHFPFKVFKGYGYRISGGSGLSNCTLISAHAYGVAVDINNGQYDNDYFLGKGNDLRNKDNIYCIPDEVIEIFAKHGWYWGGNFNICADTMHFQYIGLDYLSYQDNDPFQLLSTDGTMNVGKIVYDAQRRLAKIGYSVNRNGIYNNKTRTVIMKFQSENGLPITGEIDYKTWETLINLTHFMDYYF